MRLTNPILLLLLLLIPLLVWLRGFVLRKQSMQFSSAGVLKGLPTNWRVRLQPLMPILYALGLACLVVALARPQRGLQESLIHADAIDMILLVDLSTSMETRDFRKNNRWVNRLDATKDVIGRFLEKRPNDRIGMVAFASLPYAVAPLTLDHGWLTQRMEGLHTRMLPDGTAIGDGIASASNRLLESEAKSKVIILLTDGANSAGTLQPVDAAIATKAVGIKIYTIAAGGQQRNFRVQRYPVDTETLKKVAETTGGKFYRARDLETLEAVYEEIDQLEKTEIEVEQFTRFEEISKGWIIAGVVLLALEQLLSLSRLGRLP